MHKIINNSATTLKIIFLINDLLASCIRRSILSSSFFNFVLIGFLSLSFTVDINNIVRVSTQNTYNKTIWRNTKSDKKFIKNGTNWDLGSVRMLKCRQHPHHRRTHAWRPPIATKTTRRTPKRWRNRPDIVR